MNLRWLNNLLYVVPVVGSVRVYNDVKRENSLIDQKIAQNPDLEPALMGYKSSALASAIFPEFLGDALYSMGIGYFVLLGNSEPTTNYVKILKHTLDIGLPTAFVIVNYMIRTAYGNIIREYDRKGKVTLHTSTPITVEIS